MPHDPSLNLAGFSIITGFFSVTVLAAIRLAVPKLRSKLSGQATVIALLCIFLLTMQTVATVWATGSPVFHRIIYVDSQYERFYWFLSWALVQVLSCVAVSRLWGMRAYEVALGSALFWFWSVSYFVVRLLLLGHIWGIDFWGRVREF